MGKIIITRAGINKAEGFLIDRGDGAVMWMRKNIMFASDNPLSANEELICLLCERILSLEKEGEQLELQGNKI